MFLMILFDWISHIRICGLLFINYYFLIKGLGPFYKRNFVKFLIDFRELESLEIMSLDWVSDSHFSNEL